MFEFARDTAKVPQAEWLKQQKFIVSVWKSEAEDQGVCRPILPLRTLGKDPFS